MRIVPHRSPWAQLGTVFGGFLVGPLVALRLGLLLTPGSDLIQTVAVLAFAMIFVGGVLLWMGIGIVAAVASLLWKLARGVSPRSGAPGPGEQIAPPGYRSFVILGMLVGGAVGLLAGLVTDLSVITAGAAWGLAGLGYGALLWAAAHHGYLPFLEPE